jgi:hypothetical protein
MFFKRQKDAKAFAEGIGKRADLMAHHFVYSVYKIVPRGTYRHFEDIRDKEIEVVAKQLMP